MMMKNNRRHNNESTATTGEVKDQNITHQEYNKVKIDSNKSDDKHEVIFIAVVEWEDSVVLLDPCDGVNHLLDCHPSYDSKSTIPNHNGTVRRTKLRISRRDVCTAVAAAPQLPPTARLYSLITKDNKLDDDDEVSWERILSKLVVEKLNQQQLQSKFGFVHGNPNGNGDAKPPRLAQHHYHHHHHHHQDATLVGIEIYDADQKDYVLLSRPSAAATAMVMACRKAVICSHDDDDKKHKDYHNSRRRPMLVRLRLQPKVALSSFATTTTTTTNPNNYQPHANTENNWLAITGRYIPYHYGMNFAGSQLYVKEQPNVGVGTGGTIWDGAMLLAKYFESHPEKVAHQTVLELGAGTGLVGIAAALLGAKEVLMTDLEYCLPLLQENINRHASILQQKESDGAGCRHLRGRVDCRVLDWCQSSPRNIHNLLFPVIDNKSNKGGSNDPFHLGDDIKDSGDDESVVSHDSSNHPNSCFHNDDGSSSWIMDQQNGPNVIIIADCVWVEELVTPLLSTLQHLLTFRRRRCESTRSNSDATATATKIYISYQRRGKATHEALHRGLETLFGTTSPNSDYHIIPLDSEPSLANLTARLPPNVFYLWECSYSYG